MTRRKLTDKNIRKITRNGDSLSVTLPKEELSKLGWREKQKVIVKRVGKKFVISDWK